VKNLIKIKICGITRKEDALLAAELGAWAVGFIFVKNTPRFIFPDNAAEIIKELPQNLEKFGVFADISLEEIKNKKKIMVGVIAGFIGGAIGGGLGSGLYVSLLIDVNRPGWITSRFIEALAGAVVGMNLWFILGLVEKLYIFNRKQLLDATEKICDFCNTHNSLRAWYCKNCGKTLLVSAPVEKLKITPYRSLERISNAFKFISWLSAVAGVVLVLIIFIFLLFKNPFFAVFVSVALAIVIYMISVLLNGVSEVFTKFIKIREAE